MRGRPKGSGTAEERVREWRQQHPEGRKADCHRDTRLDPQNDPKVVGQYAPGCSCPGWTHYGARYPLPGGE